MNCPNCRHENMPSANFCTHCGTRFRITCPQCGAEVTGDERCCSRCGADRAGTAATTVPPQSLLREQHLAGSQSALPASVFERFLADPEGENRIVTVLFVDMSRSVETTVQLHPEEAAALVSPLLQVMVEGVLKYGGRVDRFLGDGVLAVFGVPQAHESDPERAIRAAMEIRDAAEKLGLGVTAGINTGDVYAGVLGPVRYTVSTVMGLAVNLAERLQGQALPGQILVGEATYLQTCRTFEFVPVSLDLKGISRPVAAYAVVRALPRPEKARGIEGLRAELIGRDEELAKLRAALEELLQGRGQMVSLIGDAGVGKSRLVSELKEGVRRKASDISADRAELCEENRLGTPDARERGAQQAGRSGLTPDAWRLTPPLWLEGRCLEPGMAASYSLFVELFREYFGWRPDEDDWARGERIAACLGEFVDRGALFHERVDDLGPPLGVLLSARFGNSWDERLKNAGPEQIRYQTIRAIRDFCVALAHRQPLVLVCEDLHWADTLSLDAISLLMEALSSAPLLLLCVYRPQPEHGCSRLGTIAAEKCAARYTEILLRDLTTQESRRLVEALLTIETLPASFHALILDTARGNPFFVEEILRSLIATGMIYREGDNGEAGSQAEARYPREAGGAARVWRAREGIEAPAVPASIQSVILSRVDRLRPGLKRVLQSASVIGRLFRLRLLEHTMRTEVRTGPSSGVRSPDAGRQPADRLLRGELERALWELEDRQLIVQERILPEVEYSFQHVLVQETIYHNILRRRRAVLHQHVAEAMGALYPDSLDEHCEQLAYHYERSGADEKAIEYLLKAGEKARRAYLNDAAIHYSQRALQRLDASAAKGDTPESQTAMRWRLGALTGLGQLYLGIGQIAEAETPLREAIALGQRMGLAPQELVRLHYWLGDLHYWQDQPDEMIRLGEEGLALIGQDTETAEAALMNHIIAVGYTLKGSGDKRREFIDRNARFLRRLPYSEELRPAYVTIVYTYYGRDKNVQVALEWLQALQENAERHHDLRGLSAMHYLRGELNLKRGHLQGALEDARRGWELSLKIGDAKVEGSCLAVLGQAFLARGDLDKAEEYTRRALEIMLGDRSDLIRCYIALGTTLLCRGFPAQAAEAFRKPAHLPGPLSASSQPSLTCALGQVFLAQGEREEAVRQFQEAIDGEHHDPLTLAAALCGLEAACDDGEAFRAFCRQAQAIHLSQDAMRGSPLRFFSHWFFEPTEPQDHFSVSLADTRFHEGEFARRKADPAILGSGWGWQDPFQDCSFTVHALGARTTPTSGGYPAPGDPGLEIRAANGRDLWDINQTAPRLLRPVSGEFAAQTVCTPPVRAGSEPAPVIGGLLLWKDEKNFLRLETGTRGEQEISFMGCLGAENVVIGRGRLETGEQRPDRGRVWLRLERQEHRVRGLCSADGERWFAVGMAEFGVEGPVEVGLHAIGHIDRTHWPAAYPDGTAIRFEWFQLWGCYQRTG